MQKMKRLTMYFIKIFVSSTLAILLCMPVLADCSLSFPTEEIIFQADINYLNSKVKANPYITIFAKGQPEKFLLDTGANHHVIWASSLIVESKDKRTLHTTNSAVEETVAHLTLTDSAGRSFKQQVGMIKNSPLSKKQIAGLISPQQLAGAYPFFINFKRGCFTVLRQLDLNKFDRYHIYQGKLEANPYQVMMIPIHINNRFFLMQVDSGAGHTAMSSSIINFFPVNRKQTPKQSIDLIGQSPSRLLPFRYVDFILNNLNFKKFSIEELSSPTNINEFKLMGRIGMDVLQDWAIIADFKQQAFHLLKEITSR
jgi:hypothetical protein